MTASPQRTASAPPPAGHATQPTLCPECTGFSKPEKLERHIQLEVSQTQQAVMFRGEITSFTKNTQVLKTDKKRIFTQDQLIVNLGVLKRTSVEATEW